jgi:hypothetical protein
MSYVFLPKKQPHETEENIWQAFTTTSAAKGK